MRFGRPFQNEAVFYCYYRYFNEGGTRAGEWRLVQGKRCVKDWKLEIHAWYREQSKEYNEKRKRYIRDPDDQVKKKRRRSRSPER